MKQENSSVTAADLIKMCLFDCFLFILERINFNLLCSTWLSELVLPVWMSMLLRKFRVHMQQQQPSNIRWQRLTLRARSRMALRAMLAAARGSFVSGDPASTLTPL